MLCVLSALDLNPCSMLILRCNGMLLDALFVGLYALIAMGCVAIDNALFVVF